MGIIQNSKYGVCCICKGPDQAVRKRGKNLYCIACCRKEDTGKQVEKAKEKNKLRAVVPAVKTKVRGLLNTDNNKLVANQAAADFDKLQKFFDQAAEIIAYNPHCMECELLGVRTFIPQKYYRAATAHVLQKRKEYGFPSIAAHPENFLVLGTTCGHHALYDRSWEDAQKMKVFPLALSKMKMLLPLISESEKKNLPDFLNT